MHSKWKDKLYVAGYLLTDNKRVVDSNIGIDWNAWRHIEFGQYELFLYPEQTVFSLLHNNKFFIMIGHAYNPFTMEADENHILKRLSDLYDTNDYAEYFDQLTGLFLYIVIDDKSYYFIILIHFFTICLSTN